MVDGIKPRLDANKPAGKTFAPQSQATKRPSSGRNVADRAYNGPSFGKDSYQSAKGRKEPLNQTASQSREGGANGAENVQSLSDPGSFAQMRGQQKMPSVSYPGKNGKNSRVTTPSPRSSRQPQSATQLPSRPQNSEPVSQVGQSNLANAPKAQPYASTASSNGQSQPEKNGKSFGPKDGNEKPTLSDNLKSANALNRNRDNGKKQEGKTQAPDSVNPVNNAVRSGVQKLVGDGTMGQTLSWLATGWRRTALIFLGPILAPFCAWGCILIVMLVMVLTIFPGLVEVAANTAVVTLRILGFL